MNQLDRLEALAQRLIEGVFNRIFQTQSDAVEEGYTNIEHKTATREVLVLAAHSEVAARWTLQLEDRCFRLGEPVVTIGRALDNDIVLSDPTISRYHAQLRWRDGRYYLYPAEQVSLNGGSGQPAELAKKTKRLPAQTTLNSRAVVQSPLDPGDVLTLGETTIWITLSPEAP
jgi:hypothetical protein